MWTVSAFQQHPQTVFVCDEDATQELRVRTVKYFKGDTDLCGFTLLVDLSLSLSLSPLLLDISLICSLSPPSSPFSHFLSLSPSLSAPLSPRFALSLLGVRTLEMGLSSLLRSLSLSLSLSRLSLSPSSLSLSLSSLLSLARSLSLSLSLSVALALALSLSRSPSLSLSLSEWTVYCACKKIT